MKKYYLFLFAISIFTAQGQNCDEPDTATGSLGCVTFTYKGVETTYKTVRTADGNIWLQQNLGSSQVATSATDTDAFGDLFQWGRWDDGHQSRNSETSAVLPEPNNPAGLGTGVSKFYTGSPEWWASGTATDKWDAAAPVNAAANNGCDPCKALGAGWQLPTQQDWQSVIDAEHITNIATAYESGLKLPVAGSKTNSGSFNFAGVRGYYWSKTTSDNGNFVKYLYYSNFIVNPGAGTTRSQGNAIRCFKAAQLAVGDNTINTFNVYPNPATTFVAIESETEISSIAVYNVLGQLISNQKNSGIDLTSIQPGIYLIQVRFENGALATRKIIRK